MAGRGRQRRQMAGSLDRSRELALMLCACARDAARRHLAGFSDEEAKLVRCTRGAIYDAIIDLRRESPTHRQWIGVELTAENYRMLYVPEGFAHGFQTLRDDTEATYQVSRFYAPGSERGVRFNDPAFGIEWPHDVRVISDKDASWPYFEGSLR